MSQTVLIIGGGAAGMLAALTALLFAAGEM